MKLNEFKEAMNIFYEINNDILNNYEMKNRNYQILENIKLITNNEIFTKLKKIDKMTDYKEKIFSIIDLYNKISSYDEDSQKNINIGNEDSSKNALFCKVALLGESNVGKTEIINILYNLTLEIQLLQLLEQVMQEKLYSLMKKINQLNLKYGTQQDKKSIELLQKYFIKMLKCAF